MNLKSMTMSTLLFLGLAACSPKAAETTVVDYPSLYPDFYGTFSSKVDLAHLPNYASQTIPNYITKNNTRVNILTDQGALLGRVLFYDKKLSSTNTISCASCHSQTHAFSDTQDVSVGANGSTARHTMRLVNARFSIEDKFFWDERAATLEIQTTQPIQNHAEMGFSGQNGDPGMADLITQLKTTRYYKDLFNYVYGSDEITEIKIQNALAQFVRSIQSFDSKYDQGRALVGSDAPNFPNFTTEENLGKLLFITPPNQGGAGCAACHQPPEFDIAPNSRNNGVTGIFGSVGQDTTVTRSPSLRNLLNPSGMTNGNFMHDASFASLEAVIEHYNSGIVVNNNLDNRLRPGGNAIRLNLTTQQKAQLLAFLKTLTGTAVYTDSRWADPF